MPATTLEVLAQGRGRYNDTMKAVRKSMKLYRARAKVVEKFTKDARIDGRDWRGLLDPGMLTPEAVTKLALQAIEKVKMATTAVVVELAKIAEHDEEPEHVWRCLGPEEFVMTTKDYNYLLSCEAALRALQKASKEKPKA